GAEVDVATERLVEQWRRDRDGAVDGGGRAGVGGPLHPGADGADVGLVEELRMGQGDRDRREVGVARSRAQDRGQGRVIAAFGSSLQGELDLRLEGEPRALGELEAALQAGDLAEGRDLAAFDRAWLTAGRVEGEVGAVQSDLDRADVEGDPLEELGDRVR